MSRRAARGAVLCAAAALAAGAGPSPAAAQSAAAEKADTRAEAVALPSTRPERTGFVETSRYADVTAFLDSLAAAVPGLYRRGFGYSEEGRPLPLVVFGVPAGTPAAEIRADPRLRVLVLANIHAGEVAGKEAALALARELAAGGRDAWLDSLVVLVAPIYNADGNERIDLRNRPRQHGPLGGMGRRGNARGLDLNRDNTKLATAEARSLARLLVELDPHVLVDLHTTNGTIHGYHLTYAPPLHPGTDPEIVQELRERWLPAATDSIRARHGEETFHYGNVPGTFGMRGERGWYTFDHRPRFTTNWAGLRNRFGILSEAYSYATFAERIGAHRHFVTALLDYAARHASRLREIVERADAAVRPGREMPLRATPVRGDTIEVLLGEVREERNPWSGEVILRRLDVTRSERMPDFTGFEGTDVQALPAAWLLPPDAGDAAARLRAQGIHVRRLEAAARAAVARFQLEGARTSEREYEGRHLRDLSGVWRTGTEDLPAGTYVVPAAQPLGLLAAILLEPRSDDGFAAWGLVVESDDGVFPVGRAATDPGGVPLPEPGAAP
ncbi:MAG: M14 family metallopeptidase [Gemmatimonadota bacterium]|nr:M14 family metallopeptidase [Gemmatimonadota bacterium]